MSDVRNILAKAAEEYGIHFHNAQNVRGFLPDSAAAINRLAMDSVASQAVDVKGPWGLSTTAPNSGIPWFMANYVDPTIIEVLVSPVKATKIIGERKIGDWTTITDMIPVSEYVGEVSTYGDFNNNGHADSNENYEFREQYLYQTVVQWGDLELARYGLARIDKLVRKRAAAVQTMTKFQNKSYFYGIKGLRNFGLLNDPDLLPAITPKAVDGKTLWEDKDGQEVFNDVQMLYTKLVERTQGIVDQDAPMTLAMSPVAKANFTKTNGFGLTVNRMIADNFPNIRLETAVEYDTDAGGLVQLIVNDVSGQGTGYAAFGEKMRDFPVIPDLSAWKQKHMAGTWGTIITQPIAIAQMIGV